jgi:Dynein heavy chain.
MWDNITELERTLPNFQGIEGSMIVSRKEWKRWFQTPDPENEHLPGEWDAKADDLRRIVLLRCLRPDRVVFAVSEYISKNLGPFYIETPPFNLDDMYKDYSKPSQPILFVLSPGVDPAPQLNFLALDKGKDIEVIPLGKGQDIKAQKALTEAAEKGFWVFLANCHLAISWMPGLEELIESLIRKNLHEDFRL